MEIAIIATEIAGFSKVGGMGDVVGTLPPFFIEKGIKTMLFSPAYKSVIKNKKVKKTRHSFVVEMGNDAHKCNVYKYAYNDTSAIFFIDHQEFFRYRNVYVDDAGILYEDNVERFVFFQKAVLELMVILGMEPDIVHCHDNQAALVPLFLKTKYKGFENFQKTKTVFTIHNIGYHGNFSMTQRNLLNLDEKYFFPMERLEWYGEINPLKAGILNADKVTTVSETHAREIMTDEILSAGMKEIFSLRYDSVVGIVNGLDLNEWNPATDNIITENYTVDTLEKKSINKKALLKECGIDKKFTNKPLYGMVTRLVEQKGIVLLMNIFEKLMAEGVPFILLGNGEPFYREKFVHFFEQYKGQFYFDFTFNKPLGHKIFAGADVFFMPSRYEPCGIAQMQSMRYGTLPLVKRTGGLNDTVDHGKTGFVFEEYHADSFFGMIKQANQDYQNKKQWREMMINAMSVNFSWERSVKKYIDLYQQLIR